MLSGIGTKISQLSVKIIDTFKACRRNPNSYSKVAKKVNLKTGDLKKLNKGVDEDTFHPGKRIRIAK